MKQQSSDSHLTRHEKKKVKLGKQVVPPFLVKTYDILQKQNHNNIICWNPQGNGFIVKNVTLFTEEILPTYFKHNNYASFVRQLNMYGFHKVKANLNEEQLFTHEKFLRNNKEALKEIRRKANIDSNVEKNEELRLDVVNNNNGSSYNQSLLLGQLRHMRKKQDELEKVVDVLAEQNKQILQDNKRLWKRMKKTMQREQKKFQNILLLFLLNGGHTSDDIILDKQRIEGNNPMNQALLPVDEQPKRQNIMDALLSRFNNQHKNNYKDQLYLQNNGQHMKLINNMVNHLNKDDNKYMLEYQNEPEPEPESISMMSPSSFPQEEIPMSPIPRMNMDQESDDDLVDHLSLQKGISAEFPPYDYDPVEERSDFMDDK